jgi:hypothetical protein
MKIPSVPEPRGAPQDAHFSTPSTQTERQQQLASAAFIFDARRSHPPGS